MTMNNLTDRAWGSRETLTNEDRQKRQAAFLRAPEVILIKVATNRSLGLHPKVRQEAKIDERHAELAEKLGVEANALRAKPDTGLPVVENANCVSLDTLVSDLVEAGYSYTSGHKFRKEGKKRDTQVLEFRLTPSLSLEQRETSIPEAISGLLYHAAFNNVYVYINRQKDAEGKEFRLDTINCQEASPGTPLKTKLERTGEARRNYGVVALDQ